MPSDFDQTEYVDEKIQTGIQIRYPDHGVEILHCVSSDWVRHFSDKKQYIENKPGAATFVIFSDTQYTGSIN